MPTPDPYPILFEPLLKEKVWGGRNLVELGKQLPAGVPIGESWELADLPESIEGGRSVIANGALAGMTLREAIGAPGPQADQIMGAAAPSPEGGFPLLVKFLDARENLSVQVHPSAAYARAHPEAHLKSEAWYVIKAEPGALIYKGVKPEVTPDRFAADIADGSVAGDLVAVPARAGDCHYLPSGTCHALGAGIVVAEIQTPSDTTFRVFDWGRHGRQLHVDQALACITFGQAPPNAGPVGAPITVDGLRTTPMAKTEFFSIERIEADARAPLKVVTSGMPVVWMMIRGEARVAGVTLAQGATALMPAGLDEPTADLGSGAVLLRVTLRSPLEGLLAGG